MSDPGSPASSFEESGPGSPLPAGYGALDDEPRPAEAEGRSLASVRQDLAQRAGRIRPRRRGRAGDAAAGDGATLADGSSFAGDGQVTGSFPRVVSPTPAPPPSALAAPPSWVSSARSDSAVAGQPTLAVPRTGVGGSAYAPTMDPYFRGASYPLEAPMVPLLDDADRIEGHISARGHQTVKLVRGVRSRRMVRRLDVWTVFKVSAIFYFLSLVVILVAGVILWNVAQAFGVINSIDKSVRTLFDLKSFVLHPAEAFGYTVAFGSVLAVLGTCVNLLAALAYNLISDVVGGIQVVVVSPGPE